MQQIGSIKKISNASSPDLSLITASIVVGKVVGGKVENGDLADNSTIGAGGLTKITNPRGIEYFDEQLFFFDKNTVK